MQPIKKKKNVHPYNTVYQLHFNKNNFCLRSSVLKKKNTYPEAGPLLS